jgi:CubicO group peptidase (beta-lactamase class C family)
MDEQGDLSLREDGMTSSTLSRRLEERLEPLIQQTVASCELAGLAIGIVQGEELIYAKGFGVRHMETREPVTADSLFHLASVSKTFVATGIMQLVEQGRLALDAPVAGYLPYFALKDERYEAITVQQMLSHVSGMPDAEEFGWEQPEEDDGALERYVRSLANETLLFAPGERFAYSNIAYEVLGDLIAKASDQSFEEYMQAQLLRPLEMPTSTFLKAQVAPALATAPHLSTPTLELSAVYPYHRAHAPSSTLHSSVIELGNWASTHLKRGAFKGTRLLQASSYDLLWHPYAPTGWGPAYESMGLGWFLGAHRGRPSAGHGGGDIGFNTTLMLLPDDGLAVAVLANSVPALVGDIRAAALDIVLGYEPEIPKSPALLALHTTLAEQGVEAALARYQTLPADQYDLQADLFSGYGELLLDLHRYAEAIGVLRLGVAADPDAAEGYTLLARAYLKAGDDRQADAAVQQALQRDPHDLRAQAIQRALHHG